MSNGGTITARMSLQGAEQVRTELAKLGPEGAKAMRELDRAMRQPTAGLRALDTAVGSARNSLDDFSGRAGAVGGALQQLGPWGVAAAAGVAAVVVAATQAVMVANQATQAAAALSDVSDRIGVGVESLQAWRYAADESNVSVAALEGGMEKLNGVLGAFKLGVGDAKLKPVFEELGITQDQLANVSTADEMLLILADTLGQVEDRASQVKLARALGIEELLPLLRQGKDGIDDLLASSRELGVVLDAEVVAKLDAAERKAELAGQQLKTLAYSAVEPLATSLANAGSWLANMSVEFSKIENRAPGWIQMMLALGRAMPGTGAVQRVAELVIGQIAPKGRGGPAPQGATLAQMQALANGPGGGGYDLRGHSSGGGGGGGGGLSAAQREREQRRAEAEREIERLQKQEIELGRDYLRDRIKISTNVAERAELSRLLADSERDEQVWAQTQLTARIEAAGLMTEEIRLRIENIAGLQQAARDAAEQARLKAEADERAEALATAEGMHLDLTMQILEMASSDARTSDERRTLELQMLELAHERQRLDLENTIKASEEGDARDRLIALLDRLPELQKMQRQAVTRDTAGPWEAWRDGLPRGMAETREWLEGEAVDALDGLSKGLIDAWKNADNAGDAFKAMGETAVSALTQITDALFEMALKRMLIEPLGDLLFGSAGEGGGYASSHRPGQGGWISEIFGGLFGGKKGFADGGRVGASGRYLVGERGPEFVDLSAGALVHSHVRAAEMVRDPMRAGGGSSAAPQITVPIKIVNQTSQDVSASQRMTADGLEVLLKPMVRGAVTDMGADGSLARANALTPRGRRR